MLILACLLMGTVVPAASLARTEARYEGRTPDAVFGNDIYASRSIQNLFHQQTLNTSDVEHYSMSFPAFGDGISLGAATGTTQADGIGLGQDASANLLPFGLVDLALPSIHEDVAYTADASQTGFFSSNYDYRAETDYGNVPITTDYATTVSQAIAPATISIPQLYPEQYDTIAINNKLKAAAGAAPATTSNETANQTSANRSAVQADLLSGTMAGPAINNSTSLEPITGLNFFKPKNASSKPSDTPTIYPSYFDMAGKSRPASPNPGYGTYSTNGAGGIGASISMPASGSAISAEMPLAGQIQGIAAGNTGIQVSSQPAQAPNNYTYADFNFDATPAQVSNMSLIDRMWRNAHRGGTMGKAYAGDTSDPLWIDPYVRPNDVSMIDEQWYVMQCALNMTVPGTRILPRLWSLMF